MKGDFWTNVWNLQEDTLLVRIYEKIDGLTWCRIVPNGLEPLGDGMRPTGHVRGWKNVEQRTPIDPVKIWCIGLNYRAHAEESKLEVPDEPCVFMKPQTCLAAHGDPVRIPMWAGRIDYEGELAVVIGRKCRNVGEDEALGRVLGYSCFNDVSARVLQKKDGQWVRSKGFDTFGPFGPAIRVARAMPAGSGITTRLNGTVVQQSAFEDMIFSVASIVAHLSRFATLEPGDVIATGTPSGVGPVNPGDVVEISVDGIATLRNPFVADE